MKDIGRQQRRCQIGPRGADVRSVGIFSGPLGPPKDVLQSNRVFCLSPFSPSPCSDDFYHRGFCHSLPPAWLEGLPRQRASASADNRLRTWRPYIPYQAGSRRFCFASPLRTITTYSSKKPYKSSRTFTRVAARPRLSARPDLCACIAYSDTCCPRAFCCPYTLPEPAILAYSVSFISTPWPWNRKG